MKRFFLFFAIVFLFTSASTAVEKNIPFSVAGKHNSSLSLLVSKTISRAQLQSLVFKIKEARRSGQMANMIQATTPGGAMGNYGVVDIYIFADSQWATSEKVRRFINSSMARASDRAFSSEFIRNVKAYYFYSSLTSEEEGSIGYDGGGKQRSAYYKKLF